MAVEGRGGKERRGGLETCFWEDNETTGRNGRNRQRARGKLGVCSVREA